MKDRKQRVIKIVAAVATCMHTCTSGHGRILAALTHTRIKQGHGPDMLLSPTDCLFFFFFAVKIMCRGTSTAPHQKVERKSKRRTGNDSLLFFFIFELKLSLIKKM